MCRGLPSHILNVSFLSIAVQLMSWMVKMRDVILMG